MIIEYLDFKDHEVGYLPFEITIESAKLNIGKTIVYLTNRDIDRNRGYAFPRYGVISKVYRNRIIMNDGNDEVYIKDIKECGIKNNPTYPPCSASL